MARRSSTRCAVTAAFVMGLAALTACSSDPAGDPDRPADAQVTADTAADAIAASVMGRQPGGGDALFAVEQAEAACIGDGFVERIGVEKLQGYGYLTEDLEARPLSKVRMRASDARSASDVLFDCADVAGLMSKALARGDRVDRATRTCLESVLTDDALRQMFTLMFRGEQEEAGQLVIAPMMECAADAPTPDN